MSTDIESNAPAPGAIGGEREASDAQSRQAARYPNTTNGDLIEASKALAALGYVPVPMIASAKRPALRGWREAAADPARALAAVEAATWADAIAIATGCGVLVLDLDIGHADNADGAVSLAALEATYGQLPDGPRSATPKGGQHRYFATPPGRMIRSRAAIAPGLDIRAEAGLAMCPPSPGRRWITPLCPWTDLPQAPSWLVDLADPPRPPPPAYRPQAIRTEGYARAVFEGELNALARAPRGERNAILFKAAARLGELAAGGALPVQAVAAGLISAAEACGLTRDDGEAAVRATIASGLRAGLRRPRAIPEGGLRND